MIIRCFACQSLNNESIVGSDDTENARVKVIMTSERTAGGQPALSEEEETEAVDVGGRQVKEQMFIRHVEVLQAQRIAHEQVSNLEHNCYAK